MKSLSSNKKIAFVCLLVILGTAMISSTLGAMSSSVFSSQGVILYAPRIDITVDIAKIIGTNNLSIGFMLDNEWKKWRDTPELRELSQGINTKLIRIFDWKSTSPRPCNYWNETAKTGKFDWAEIDKLVQQILDTGAEPLFCLGGFTAGRPRIPAGMAVNPNTNLPYPASFATYAAEWIKHFKTAGLSVRFYEIINEPFNYFGWTADYIKLQNYVDLWNATAKSMRARNSEIMLSNDFITARRVFDYWIQHGERIDFLDFHKYDSSKIGEASDSEMFRRAETNRYVTTSSTYGIQDAKKKWLSSRGKYLLAIDSEANFDSTWVNGSDPKIQKMAGAVWTGLMLRAGVLKGLDYNIYFQFGSSKKSNEVKPSGGFGFGMVNLDNGKPWYPYYVNQWFGKNMQVGDQLLSSSSSSEDVRCLVWRHGDKINIIVISKANEARNVYIQGLGKEANVYLIDNTVPFENPYVQNSKMNMKDPLNVKGYTVAFLQVSS